MPYSFRQGASGTNAASVSTLVTTFGTPTVKGNLVVLLLKINNVGATGLTVTDDVGNVYVSAAAAQSVSGVTMGQVFYGVQITGGATTITANWTTAAACRMLVNEFRGGRNANTTILDTAIQNTGTGTTATAALVPTANGELVWTAIFANTTQTSPAASSGYTIDQLASSSLNTYKVVATMSETNGATWTGSVTWAETTVCFRPATHPNLPLRGVG